MKMDAIYRDELEQMKKENVLTDVYTALSREKNVPKVLLLHNLKFSRIVLNFF